MVKQTRGFWRKLQGEAWLSSMLILVLGSSTMAFGQKGVPHLVVRQTASQSLTLIKPTDQDFDNTLNTYFPGLSLENGYKEAIKPFLVIVKNDTALPAAAYALQWTQYYADGSVRSLPATFVNRHLMQSVATTYIMPQGIRLISPLFNVTPKDYQWYQSFGEMFPASHFPPLNGATSVDVSLDGVVYNDGTFIGPDKRHILQRHVMARFAERDEVLGALSLINSSKAPQFIVAGQLQQILDQQVQWKNKAYQFTLLARYVRARGRSAEDLQRILRDRALSGLGTALQSFVDHSGGNTNPSSFDGVYKKLSDNDPRVFGDIHSWIRHQIRNQGLGQQ